MLSFTQSPVDPDFVQDPYPFYDRARTSGDLFWWEDFGLVAATSHKAVMALLKDRRLGREVPAEKVTPVPDHLKPFYDIDANSMLDMEPPRHTRLRSLVLRAFTSRRIASLAPEIGDLANSLIDAFPSGSFDLLPAYCQKIPVIVIARLLGVPDTKCDDLLRWSNAMVAMYQARRSPEIEMAAVDASLDFTAFLHDLIAHRRRSPGPDLISELIAAEEDGNRLTTDELIGTVILLLNAGHEATVHAMGNAVPILIKAGRPEVTPEVAEETLRLDPPLHIFRRWVYEDLSAFGHDFVRGDEVALVLGAANRCPTAFQEPNAFNPARKGLVQTGFGGGIHFCVGAPLARLEMSIGLKVLFERCPKLKINEAPSFGNTYHFHGLERLVVQIS